MVFIASYKPFAVVKRRNGRIILITLRILKLSMAPLQAGFIWAKVRRTMKKSSTFQPLFR